MFGDISWPTLANQSVFIRVIRDLPFLCRRQTLYSSCFLSGHSWPPHLPQAKKNSRICGNPDYWQAVGNYFFVEQVLIPTNGYKGQKLTRLVNRNTPPSITRINPGVPATVPLKYKKANTAASNTRIMRSAVPMFGFIITSLKVERLRS